MLGLTVEIMAHKIGISVATLSRRRGQKLSLALLEILVHLDPAAHIPELVALSIRVPLADIQTFKPITAQPDTTTFPWHLRETRA